MSRKVSMVIVAVFGLRATVQTQALMALLVVLLAAAAHIYAKPFDVVILDRLELYGLITAFITLYFGMFFFTRDVEESPFFLAVITIIILSANFAFVSYWFTALYHALCEEIMLVKRFHIAISLSCHSCTERYFKNCQCTKKCNRAKKKWRSHHKGSESDSEDSDDEEVYEINLNRKRGGSRDHTVWDSMKSQSVERDSLKSIHKRRHKKKRKSVKRALEMAPMRRVESFRRVRKLLDNEMHEQNLNDQIRANKAATMLKHLGKQEDSTLKLHMLPPPSSLPPPPGKMDEAVPLPPPLPPPPGNMSVNPLVRSHWQSAFFKVNTSLSKIKNASNTKKNRSSKTSNGNQGNQTTSLSKMNERALKTSKWKTAAKKIKKLKNRGSKRTLPQTPPRVDEERDVEMSTMVSSNNRNKSRLERLGMMKKQSRQKKEPGNTVYKRNSDFGREIHVNPMMAAAQNSPGFTRVKRYSIAMRDDVTGRDYVTDLDTGDTVWEEDL